jgi:hypothetical protein
MEMKELPKIKISRRVMHWLVSHPWLKLIALILAIIVWFYVRGEITRFNY